MAVALSLTFSAAADRPNIILIMVDDMGFSDIGCYGGEIDTPIRDAICPQGKSHNPLASRPPPW